MTVRSQSVRRSEITDQRRVAWPPSERGPGSRSIGAAAKEVLLLTFSRFVRGAEDFVRFKDEFQNHSGGMVSMKAGDDSATGEESVVRGQRAAVASGFCVGSSAPYGYERVYVQDGTRQLARHRRSLVLS